MNTKKRNLKSQLIQGKARTAIRGLTRVIFLSGISKKSATNDIVKQQTTSKDIKMRGAQLHLIIQFPILNTSGISDPATLASRQKEYIYCLQRNLLSPDVSPGYFRVLPNLCFKMRLMQIKLIFTRKVLHVVSFWKREFLYLGNDLL